MYTAGYFAPEYITEAGMNVIVIDAFDWANRIGDQPEDNPEGVDFLYEGVIAHELEHLLMNYSDAGELSWVDEGLADFAAFLNGYPAGGSHITYHQVFHRETSLTRWGGGLENYGASFSFALYLWEQAGGNGDGTFSPDKEYDDAGGDLLIKLIFEEQADGMEGVQNAIDTYNALPGTDDLPSAEELFKDWVIALYADDESSDLFNFINLDFGDPDTTAWTIQLANDLFFKNRGTYKGNVPSARFQNDPHAPEQIALPYGTSYETFRNPGGTFEVNLDGDNITVIAPHTGETHWYGGYESLDDNILNVDYTSGGTIDFWTWYFIEEGWDYGFVEAEVNGEWVSIPLTNDAGTVVTTNTDPHDNNEEGNGLTGTSGGAVLRRRSRSTFISPAPCRRAPPTCSSAIRPMRRTSTPAGSSTTSSRRRAGGAELGTRASGSRRPASRTTTGCSRSCRRAISPRAWSPRSRRSTRPDTCIDSRAMTSSRVGSRRAACVDPGQLRRRDLEPADRRPDLSRRRLRLPAHEDEVTPSSRDGNRREPGPTRPGSRDSWGSARRAGGTRLAARI